MIYFWAFLKTLGSIIVYFFFVIAIGLGVIVLASLMMQHAELIWKGFLIFVLAAMSIGLVVGEFIHRLEKEKAKKINKTA